MCYRSFFEFLLTNEIAVAHEVCNEYVDTMGKVYFSYFKSYSSNLKKLQVISFTFVSCLKKWPRRNVLICQQYEEAATKEDLLGASESGNRGFFSKSSFKQKNTVFTIGNRGDVLNNQLEAPVIIPHSAQQHETRVSQITNSYLQV